jgi:glucose/arabinose dehydrogenase
VRRFLSLALFGIISLVVIVGLLWTFRGRLTPFDGVNVDAGVGGRAELVLPAGYEASVFAEGLSVPRFMAVSPDGVLFVAERGADRVVALPDTDADGVADEVVEVGAGFGGAHDIEFTDDGVLLVAGESALYSVALEPDGIHEAGRQIIVDDLPTGGGHTTRTVEVLRSGEILLSIGSSCDACLEEDDRRAAISLVTAAGNQRLYMTGLRNAVGLWVDPETGRAWATVMGRDRLGNDRPPETLYEVVDGADGGWPRCHAGAILDPEFGGIDGCERDTRPAATFPAHTAPLALVAWEEHLVVALHGSWNSSVKVGYKLVWLPWDGGPAGDISDLATGFLPDGATDALGRPAGLAVGLEGALYVSDDKAGFIYRIAHSGGNQE